MGSSFSNFTSELTGSIIHELVDSIKWWASYFEHCELVGSVAN